MSQTNLRRKSRARIGKVICVIPDTQVKPGVPLEHLRWIGNYIADKKPDIVVQVGDFSDMPSLSSYALGKAEAEGTRYAADVQATHLAMETLMAPIRKTKGYKPELHLTLGNHEDRITREVNANPRLIGAISINDLKYEKFGWKVHPFLKVVKLEGWEFSHYFTSGVMGRPVTSAAALLRQRHCSAVQGHVQLTDLAFHPKTGQIGIIAGCAYVHDEKYLTLQGNTCRRQIIFLHEVCNGTGDPMFVSLAFLGANYS